MKSKQINLKTKEEIELMRNSALLVSKTLGYLTPHIKPGISPLFLDQLAHDFILDHGGKPAFLGLYDFPNTLCISINEAVVHGIPNDKPLKEGDIISVDCGVLMNDFYGDHAYTFEVGKIDPLVKQLLETTKESLYLAASLVEKGNRIGDIGQAIQQFCQKKGYSVVRELTGHGLGKKLHEAPEVPNFGKKGSGALIEEGLVIAIEPMINLGTKEILELPDHWTLITADRKPSAHFEHNIAVINGKPALLSTFDYIYAEFDKMGITYTDYRGKYFPALNK